MDFSQQSQVEYECRLPREGWILLRESSIHSSPCPALITVVGTTGKAPQLVLSGSPTAPAEHFCSQGWGKWLSLTQRCH